MKKNQLREGLKGKKLSSHPMFMFIHERQVDWAVIITCAFLPIPYVVSKYPLFLSLKLICSFLIWYFCHKYFLNYSLYLKEYKVFNEIEKILGKQLQEITYTPEQFKEIIDLEVNCFASIERLVKKGPLFLPLMLDSDSTKTTEEKLKDILGKVSIEEREVIEKDSAAVNLGARIMGGHLNLFKLGLDLNRLRKVDSKFPNTLRILYLMIAFVFVFFFIYTLENSVTWTKLVTWDTFINNMKSSK